MSGEEVDWPQLRFRLVRGAPAVAAVAGWIIFALAGVGWPLSLALGVLLGIGVLALQYGRRLEAALALLKQHKYWGACVVLSRVPERAALPTSSKLPVGETLLLVPWMLDLNKSGHILIGGSTGGGKSTVVRCIVTRAFESEIANVWLIDLKVGVELRALAGDAKVRGFAVSVDAARVLLRALKSELEIEAAVLSRSGMRKMTPRSLLVIDELADLLQDKECDQLLAWILSKSRALGLRVVAATQQPTTDTVRSSLRQNFDLRVVLRCASSEQAKAIFGTMPDDLGRFDARNLKPGRGIVKTGGKFVRVNFSYCP